MKQPTPKQLAPRMVQIMAMASAAIIVLMPFHAFLSVWTSQLMGYYTAVRLWKEVLLGLLVAGCIYLLVTQPKVRDWVRRERLVWLVLAYAALLAIVGSISFIAGGVSGKAFAYGYLLDTRFLAFFLITWTLGQYTDILRRSWHRLLLVPAGVTIIIAAAQYLLLPADFLKHFGYGPDTIPASSTIDQKAAYQRIQSTLRGANPYGAYLVMILSASGAFLLAARGNARAFRAIAGYFALAGLALFATYSRSAWLGAVAAIVWLIWTAQSSGVLRKRLLIFGVAAVLSFGIVSILLRENDTFQNLVFHTNEHSSSAKSSNSGHFAAMEDGLKDIVHEPWGSGPGTAGPASIYNDGKANIAENYYIQIGQEAGVVGLALFVAINVLVARRLYDTRKSLISQILLASFIGLIVVNMLLHAWTDDTLAYIWWGLAGVALAGVPGMAGEKA